MVAGGFKVWHIMFIIVALVVTFVVVYCCFHRCRIPRTKQEIEADLMKTTLTNKFRDYLQEMTSEQITFVDALKRVQEIAEKLEEDDAALARELGNRKRMGWLKLKGKGPEKDQMPTNLMEASAEELARQQQLLAQEAADQNKDSEKPDSTVVKLSESSRQTTLEKVRPKKQESIQIDDILKRADSAGLAGTKAINKSVDRQADDADEPTMTKTQRNEQISLLKVPDHSRAVTKRSAKQDDKKTSATSVSTTDGRPKPVRRRREKPPNLTRTKATGKDLTTNKEPDETPKALEIPPNDSRAPGQSSHTHRSKAGKAKLTKGSTQVKQVDQPKDSN